MENKLRFAFFGTSPVSVSVLEALKASGYTPKLIVTTPDRPRGRKFVITSSPVKVWALENKIDIIQPERFDVDLTLKLSTFNFELFIVVAYGKIIPKTILEIPANGSLNIHYSLLPKLRGSSPVEGAILADEKNTGVSIILMDEKMDHGPILAQEKVTVENWPPKRSELMSAMNTTANKLLVSTIPKWIAGELTPVEQNHTDATFVSLIKKEDAQINLTGDEYENFKKIQAYEEWPRAYFMENGKRVIINSAEWKDGRLEIVKVTPEGRKEINYADYLRNNKSYCSKI